MGMASNWVVPWNIGRGPQIFEVSGWGSVQVASYRRCEAATGALDTSTGSAGQVTGNRIGFQRCCSNPHFLPRFSGEDPKYDLQCCSTVEHIQTDRFRRLRSKLESWGKSLISWSSLREGDSEREGEKKREREKEGDDWDDGDAAFGCLWMFAWLAPVLTGHLNKFRLMEAGGRWASEHL